MSQVQTVEQDTTQITLADLVDKLAKDQITRFELYKATPKMICMKLWVTDSETERVKSQEFLFYTRELDAQQDSETWVNFMFLKLLAELRRVA